MEARVRGVPADRGARAPGPDARCAPGYEADVSIAQAAPLPLLDSLAGRAGRRTSARCGGDHPPAGLAARRPGAGGLTRQAQAGFAADQARGRWRDGRPEAVVTTPGAHVGPGSSACRGRERGAPRASGSEARPGPPGTRRATEGPRLRPSQRRPGRRGPAGRQALSAVVPGEPPSRPQPGWAALAGVALAAALLFVRAHGGPHPPTGRGT